MPGLSPVAKARYFDSNGDPLVGGKLYTYIAGTTTPKVTYQDINGYILNTNPIILDANGECDLWLGTSYYKMVLKDSNDVVQWTVDNVTLPVAEVSGLPVGGTIRQVLKKIDSTNYNAEWVDSVKVTGTSTTPQSITAAGGIAFTGYADKNVWYVKSNGGAVTITANPKIAAGMFDGQQLDIIQMSATDTLSIPHGTGVYNSGASDMILDEVRKVASYIWDHTAALWNERSRS